nr:DNA-dependent protein kinase catalytic subunit-like [Aedes albopictus]
MCIDSQHAAKAKECIVSIGELVLAGDGQSSAETDALILLERHSALFSPFLYVDYVQWQNILTTKWLRSSVEDRKVAIFALHFFHREIARQLLAREDLDESTSTGSTEAREARVTVLNYFMKYFKNVLMATGSKFYEIKVAIRGFGMMAEACSCLMSEEYMNELLLLVMQRTEFVYLVEEKSNELLETFAGFRPGSVGYYEPRARVDWSADHGAEEHHHRAGQGFPLSEQFVPRADCEFSHEDLRQFG